MHSGAALRGFFLVNLSNPYTSIKIGMNILYIGYFFFEKWYDAEVSSTWPGWCSSVAAPSLSMQGLANAVTMLATG